MKKKNILVAMAMLVALSVPANIASAQTLDDRIDEIGVDKAAHFGACYIISDQLARHTKMTPLERFATTMAIGYAKEKLCDSSVDNHDLIADGLGALTYEIRF